MTGVIFVIRFQSNYFFGSSLNSWFQLPEVYNQVMFSVLIQVLIDKWRLPTVVIINYYSFILRYYLYISSNPTDIFMSTTNCMYTIYTTFVTAATCNIHRISQFQWYLMLMFSWLSASYMLFHTSTSFCKEWSLMNGI